MWTESTGKKNKSRKKVLEKGRRDGVHSASTGWPSIESRNISSIGSEGSLLWAASTLHFLFEDSGCSAGLLNAYEPVLCSFSLS